MSSTSVSDRRKKKSTIIRLAIAGVAVLGIGAAITTAAWTDQAWFTAEADTASVGLFAALSVGNDCPEAGDAAYVPADDLAGAVTIALAPDAFAGLTPGETRSVGICLWNGGTADLSTSVLPIDVTGDPVFDGVDPATIEVRDGLTGFTTTTIAADEVVPLNVAVTTPADWDDSYQGVTSGQIAITFQGTTDLP